MAAPVDNAAAGTPEQGGAPAPARADLLGAQKDNLAQLTEISRHAQTTFLALVVACVYSYLTIATTTDAALLSNSSATPLPIIQVNVPIVWFYWFAPVILTVLFVYFHLYLERFWRGVARLPLRHPDGRGLDDYVYPWLIACAVIRGEIDALSGPHRRSARLEAWLGLMLGWGLVPIVLLFYWARYVVAHDVWGTALHAALALLSIGVAVHYRGVARNALRQMNAANPPASKAGADAADGRELELTGGQRRALLGVLLGAGAVLAYLSSAALHASSMPDCGVADETGTGRACRFHAPGRQIWHMLRVEPYAEVRENRFIAKPGNWNELLEDRQRLDQFLDGQRSLLLEDRDLRHLVAKGSFMPGSRFSNAVLDHADLRFAVLARARLADVDLRRARLDDADLRHAEIAGTQLEALEAAAVRLDHVQFQPSASGRPSRLSGIFSDMSLDDAQGDGVQVNTREGAQGVTQMNGATLRRVLFMHWAFRQVDLGGAVIEDAVVANSDWQDVNFGGAVIRRTAFSQGRFTRCRFIGPTIDDVLFDEAEFVDCEFDTLPSTPGLDDNGVNEERPRARVDQMRAMLAVFTGGTRIRNLHFVRASLLGARFKGATLTNVVFEDSDLTSADLSGVDLSRVQFRGLVQLNGANLAQATGVTAELLASACGSDTRLPPGLSLRPCQPGTAP